MSNPLQLKPLNHISMICRSVEDSIDFYQNVLGFISIQRPGLFDFDGYSAMELAYTSSNLKTQKACPRLATLTPKDNHISFQCKSIAAVERKLKIEYVKRRAKEGKIYVDQLFFHDPDGSMIEIATVTTPVVPL